MHWHAPHRTALWKTHPPPLRSSERRFGDLHPDAAMQRYPHTEKHAAATQAKTEKAKDKKKTNKKTDAGGNPFKRRLTVGFSGEWTPGLCVE